MENITYLENENSIVILMNKLKLDRKTIDLAKRFFFLQTSDTSHIPYVSDEEQSDIEAILKNPECNEFVEKSVIVI